MMFEIRDLTCYEATVAHASSDIPFDQNVSAMHALFSSLGKAVLADVDAYTSGAYDTGNGYGEKQIAMETVFRMSRQEFEEGNARLRKEGIAGSIGNAFEIRRAYDVLEAVNLINTTLNVITEPTEAWKEALRIATTARFKREMSIILQAQRVRGLGATALQ
jgi:hypothetical protein